MLFTTNHDENSWHGTVFDRLGEAAEAFAVFTCVFRGMPLIYSGQEAGLNKSLEFFERVPIEWREHKFREMYTKLFHLKKTNKALWNGLAGGDIVRLNTGKNKNIYSFAREKAGDKVIAIFNFSAEKQAFSISNNLLAGSYTNLFTGKKVELPETETFALDGWDYLVLTNPQITQ